jgi:hypothetical protein
MSQNVTFATLENVARSLERAARAVDDAGHVAPAGIDAGDMTSLVTLMMSRVTESAVGLSEGLAAAGAGVRESLATYSRTDDSAAARFRTLVGP